MVYKVLWIIATHFDDNCQLFQDTFLEIISFIALHTHASRQLIFKKIFSPDCSVEMKLLIWLFQNFKFLTPWLQFNQISNGENLDLEKLGKCKMYVWESELRRHTKYLNREQWGCVLPRIWLYNIYHELRVTLQRKHYHVTKIWVRMVYLTFLLVHLEIIWQSAAA